MIACEFCDKKFTRKDNMLRHINHVHCGGKFNEVNSSNLFDSSDESSNDKPEVEMSDNEETVDPWFEMILSSL